MSKTNIKLAREAGLNDFGVAWQQPALDRYTALVEARLMAKLLEGAGEPVAWLNPYGGLVHQCRTGLEKETFTIPLHTPEQISAAVLREREECAKVADPVGWAHESIKREIAYAIRNRGTK